MYCDNCGRELKEFAKYCSICGQEIRHYEYNSLAETIETPHEIDNKKDSFNSNKKKKQTYKKTYFIVCTLILTIIAGLIVYNITPTRRMSRQIDLGNKYLQELDYENAIVAFTKALQIDEDDKEVQNLLAEAYLGLVYKILEDGDIYIAQDKIEEARRILGDREEFRFFDNDIKNLVQKDPLITTSDIQNEKNEFDNLSDMISDNLYTDLQIGQSITLGEYEQDNDFSNGKEPIEWMILDIDDDRALLVSRYVLDVKPFNQTNTNVTWETCDLREWLNKDFFNEVFADNERSGILTTEIDNTSNMNWMAPGGNNTKDKIFCLSVAEVLKYYDFSRYYEDTNGSWWGYSQELVTEATPYAKTKARFVSEIDEETRNYCGFSEDMVGKNGIPWWLRSPAYENNTMIEESFIGCIQNYDDGMDVDVNSGVRPAMWIRINKIVGKREE